MIESHKDLLVWQRSMALVVVAYRLAAKLPASEKWGLVGQMCRSAVSVPSNVAEGYGRQATGEYRHHLCIGRGSLLELETQVILCERLGFLCGNDTDPVLAEIQEISKMLYALINKLS